MRVPSLVRKQLLGLSLAGLVCTAILALVFLRVPEALGIGRYEISADFDRAAGLYSGAEVTYLGTPVGKVTDLHLDPDGITVDMRLRDDASIPASVTAEVHSRSAVGEQYVALVPPSGSATASSARLADGAEIARDRTSVPIEIGPVLDHTYALIESVDADKLNTTLTEAGAALQGRSGDLQALIDHGSSFIDKADANYASTEKLLTDTEPLLTTVNAHGRNIRSLSTNLGQLTDELAAGDGDLRRLLADGPSFSTETVAFLDDLDRKLPALLEPLNVITRVLVRYDANLAATLTAYPKSLSIVQSVTKLSGNDSKIRLSLSNADDPPECTEGFLPPSQWTSPFDTAPKHTPLVYCQAAHSDPRGVRGARNIPCPNDPARRTGDARECRP